MAPPYALTILAPRDQGYDLTEQLGFDEITEAIAAESCGPMQTCSRPTLILSPSK